jgi:hypothetical protein
VPPKQGFLGGSYILTTVTATPVVIAMEGVALGTGGSSVVFNLVCDKVLSLKARKHIRIMMIAEAKINTLSDHISRALKDNHYQMMNSHLYYRS